MQDRCEKVASLVDDGQPAVCWGQYNEECDLLEEMIPDAIQVAGCDSDDVKERRLEDFTFGRARVLVTKGKLAGLGLNWQHCGHQCFFPSHSFEMVYQSIRRSLRFGRTDPVAIDIVSTQGEEGVMKNLEKKQARADRMFEALVRHMNDGVSVEMREAHTKEARIPEWLSSTR